MKYYTTDLAIIIPTKDRPNQIKRHLQSLLDQNCELGRIIVVASGEDIEELVLSFTSSLPVEYYRSQPGQIQQRNLGISKLDGRTKLVATMDDDITYEQGAINSMILFWNSQNEDTGGVGFNIINVNMQKSSYLRCLMGIGHETSGKVLKSGINTPIILDGKDIQSEWLTGGATVWLQSILINNKHGIINCSWAVYEDVIFSFPLGQIYNLYVSYSSQVNIEDVKRVNQNGFIEYYQGRLLIIMRGYFVSKNDNLRFINYFLLGLIEAMYNLFASIIRFNSKVIYNSIGRLIGLTQVFWYVVSNHRILDLVE